MNDSASFAIGFLAMLAVVALIVLSWAFLPGWWDPIMAAIAS